MAVAPEEYRQALRKFASGITVVTVASNERFHGMTASSFAAVSLQPPLILVCLEKSSTTRSFVLESRTFAVNFLSDFQESLARTFSQSGEKPFGELKYRLGRTGAPLLEGAIAWIECSVNDVLEAGDHDVFIGEILAADQREGAPLVYFDRAYRSLLA
ncbi:MAG: flavin reductase family protein [Actinomycetota bacterium]|nr:flavin reductase family protein [Actinomycetota bacterium]